MTSLKGQLLYLINNTFGLLFYRSAFYHVDLENGKTELIAIIPEGGFRKILGRIRLTVRLFRMEPRCTEKLYDNKFVICHAHKVWLLDVKQKSFTVLQDSREGFSNPLNFCSDGKSVYWGDYGDNASSDTVNIYRVNSLQKVEIVYSFPKGTIRHIHNIVWDKVHNRYFILTGDLEEKSGIYVADSDWKEVKPVIIGSQQYRAVVAFPCGDGLIYATDSVAEENNIYLLQYGEVSVLAPFPGSCIYGTETRDYYVFSSTVEPPEGRGFFNMFTYKLGAGIQDRNAHLVLVRKNDLQVQEVLKVKKDIWPMKLFQYGALIFPKGQWKSNNELYFNVVACKGDGKVMGKII